MCIFCVVQRWSRRVASMLPWLVVPFVVLWVLSQLLPPNLRFEITSPRLACFVVLLMTLLWYEILMPKLSVWRARRSARMLERQRMQAIELQKLRRAATKRCRNCFTPYRDQNPGAGGKFMCCYCGHVSKRPVLDLSGWPDWTGECGGTDGRCLAEKSYSGAYRAACSVLFRIGFCIGWIAGKVFRIGKRDRRSNGENKGLSGRRGENSGQESRVEKARRKAEEKRQARLEREMLEEEERKQREEVAKLVEERRKLRDEVLEAERGRSRSSSNQENSRKETEKRKKERKRGDKDKGSSKSNSDVEEQERRANSREGEKKRDLDKKNEIERQRALLESIRSQAVEAGNGSKTAATSKTRYFDRVKGTLLSSSRGFNGTSIFGRNAQSAAAPTAKANKPAAGSMDHSQNNSGIKRDVQSACGAMEKSTLNGDTRPVGSDLQPRVPAPKKGWRQLFTRSSAVSPDPDSNIANFVHFNGHLEAKSGSDQILPPYAVDNGFNFKQSFPLSSYSSPSRSLNGNLFSHVAPESMFPQFKEPLQGSLLDDTELFEDPCYVPDPVSLFGNVSSSLDKFPLDLGHGFVQESLVEDTRILKNITALPEVSKPSPIESPLSKSRVSEEKHGSSTTTPQKSHSSSLNEPCHAQTWQMWGSPSAEDGLGFSGGPSSWFSPMMQNRESLIHPLPQGPVISQIGTNCPSLPSIQTQNIYGHNQYSGGTFNPLGPGLVGNDQWSHSSPFQSPLSVDGENHFLPHDLMDNIARNEVTYKNPNISAPIYPVEALSTNGWSKEERVLGAMKEAANPALVRPPNLGGRYSTGPDVQSFWSYNQQ